MMQIHRPTMYNMAMLLLLTGAVLSASGRTAKEKPQNNSRDISSSKAIEFFTKFINEYKNQPAVNRTSPNPSTRKPVTTKFSASARRSTTPASSTTSVSSASSASSASTTISTTLAASSPSTTPKEWRPNPKDYTYDAPILPSPDNVDDCLERPKHWKYGDHWYFYSAHEERYQTRDEAGLIAPSFTWEEAFAVCRKHCMDPVNIETEDEWNMVRDFINENKVQFTWTSGRKCDFRQCDEIADIEPIIVNGWYWLGTLNKLSPTNKLPTNPNGTVWKEQPWLERGNNKSIPQPDNAELFLPWSRRPESCLGLIWRAYDVARVGWHDIACYHLKYVMCEDNDVLLEQAQQFTARDNATL